MKTSEKARQRNRAYRSQLRQAIKDVREETNKEAALKKLREAERLIDRATGKNLLHKNNAARQVSRLTQYVNGLA
jgi:small subunit ribosomal protein S20